eukprot:TRINITY_DN14919_c0_g1_i1.p1 TRINITY_DN14919_c0_g1~~TRINITY_DN14919_c0_g1_i1.p1  ORF type:complete len:293 (+),score=109.04 TRINITY_DN14919_c0_g1_i1:92-880(+)
MIGESNQKNVQLDILEKFAEFKSKHLDDDRFEAILSVASDSESQLDTHFLMKNRSEIFGAFGIHPLYAKQMEDKVVERMKEYMKDERTVAWGEIGLDYHDFGAEFDYAKPDLQKEIFIKQMKWALECNKPIIIHTREAEEDTLVFMKEYIPKDWKIHVHCFTDSLSFAQKLMEHFSKLWFGFTGVITFKNSQLLCEIVKEIPMERLLLETDGPFMAPIPFRGKICHSGHILPTAQKIADIKQISLEQVLQSCRANTREMYGI